MKGGEGEINGEGLLGNILHVNKTQGSNLFFSQGKNVNIYQKK